MVDRLNEVASEYQNQKITMAEARVKLKSFLAKEGYTPSISRPLEGQSQEDWENTQRLTNLASTARLELILQQNADMADAVGTYFNGRDPDIEAEYPYWKYISMDDARPSHAKFNGKIFKKSDPVWNWLFPPRDFRCRCYVEDIAEKELPKNGASKLTSADYDLLTQPNESGFSFNPRDAFASWTAKDLQDKGITWTHEELIARKIKPEDVESKLKGLRLRPQFDHKTNEIKNVYHSAQSLGLPKLDFTGAPKLTLDTKINELESKLKKGFEVQSIDGGLIKFDESLINHWNEKEEKTDTKSNRIHALNAYIKTIKTPDERWEQEGQVTYIKKFKNEKNGERVSIVVVKNNGTVFNAFISSDPKDARKGLSYAKY